MTIFGIAVRVLPIRLKESGPSHTLTGRCFGLGIRFIFSRRSKMEVTIMMTENEIFHDEGNDDFLFI